MPILMLLFIIFVTVTIIYMKGRQTSMRDSSKIKTALPPTTSSQATTKNQTNEPINYENQDETSTKQNAHSTSNILSEAHAMN